MNDPVPGGNMPNGHTPGPWTYRLDPSHQPPLEKCSECGQDKPLEPWNFLVEGKASSLIAKTWVHLCKGESVKANARLIASAPDLLAACKAVRAAMDEMSDQLRDAKLDAADGLIAAAIGKAEGD